MCLFVSCVCCVVEVENAYISACVKLKIVLCFVDLYTSDLCVIVSQRCFLSPECLYGLHGVLIEVHLSLLATHKVGYCQM